MKKTKIFFFCPSLVAGGLERVLSVLSAAFAEHFSHVEYIMWHDKPIFYDIDKNVNVISVTKECGSNSFLRKILWLKKYVIGSKPDLLVSFSSPFNMIALTALAGSQIKVIVAERIDPGAFRWGRLRLFLRDILYKHARAVFVQTHTEKKHLTEALQEKAVVIPNPVVIPPEMIGVYNTNRNSPTIVAAGRLSRQKRFDILISAFSSFVKTHPDYKLIIYGEGSERTSLERLTASKSLQSKVSLPGVSNKLWEKIKTASMFVMTSEYEGMSNVLIEAMCLGLPCISTKVSGAIDYIKNEDNGILIDVGDDNALLNAMIKIADDKAFAAFIGKNAVNVYQTLNVDTVSKQWIEVVDSYVGL